ncbi:BQ5605_C001g00859 [Microbotryum silenes-dioicae]|uniref:BQ5605_C001g00859 protein n=1 Tax=Microbotryum silenes-dioicae TaxID=796604 RepID=A0A2X0M7S8_9BASI|nr:BQ5605_C001g00859 [Microbotryum silenes-dioicae]
MHHLRRLPSAASFSSMFGGPPPSSDTTPTSPSSEARSRSFSIASSSLADALDNDIHAGLHLNDGEGPSSPIIDEVSVANSEIIAALEALQITQRAGYSERLRLIAKIQHIMIDQPETRNAFREHGGFLNAVSVLASLEERAAAEHHGGVGIDTSEQRHELRYELVKLVFAVLALAFEGHDVNRSTFNDTVGYEAIGEAIKLSGLMEAQIDDKDVASGSSTTVEGLPASPTPAEKLFSILYAFLTADFSSPPIYSYLRRHLNPPSPAETESAPVVFDADAKPVKAVIDLAADAERIVVLLAERADAVRESGGEAAEHPEVVPLMLNLASQLGENEIVLRLAVLSSLLQLIWSSTRSQVALNEVGLVGIALSRLIPSQEQKQDDLSPVERDLWIKLMQRTLEMGSDTHNSRRLFQLAVKGWQGTDEEETLDEEVLELILIGVRRSRFPSFIHFDLSPTGYSALVLPSLGRVFPPATVGYTFMGWISIDVPPRAGDSFSVLGCGDSSGKCHFQLSITSDLQFAVSTSPSKPPVVFTNHWLQLGKFQHVALVHQRPKYVLSSPISLYVDGQLVDTSKIAYPTAPPKDCDVQAWLGTPTERVAEGGLGKGLNRVKWNLGPTWLLHAELPEQMIYVCWTLGPRYAGLFQDQLGQFQTNASSTDLNVRLEIAASNGNAQPATQALIQAIRERGSAVVPDHKIYFAFSALNVLAAGSSRGILGTGLSDRARQALASTAASPRGKAIVNSAIPRKIDDVLLMPNGLGHLTQAHACNPRGLDAAVWKIGGVSVVTKLIELSKTSAQLATTVQLFVECIQDSWRNSEDAERTQAYETLAYLLRHKASLIDARTHDIILSFCGLDVDEPTRSIVSNVLAFRFIILDLVLWGATDLPMQQRHLQRLRDFVQRSEHASFNMRRVVKMHLVRKLLFSLRAGLFYPSMNDEIVDFLMLVVTAHFSTETVRHVATFLTATLCQVVHVSAHPIEPAENIDSPDPEAENPAEAFVLDVRRLDAGSYAASLRVLSALHDLVLGTESTQALAKFAKVITTKWTLLFILDRTAPPLAAVLSLRILVRLLQTQGSAFAAKFANSTDGYQMLRSATPHLWNFGQIHLALFALLHGRDISKVSLDADFSPSVFATCSVDLSPVASEVVRVLVACVARGVMVLERKPAEAVTREFVTPQIGIDKSPALNGGENPKPRLRTRLSLAQGFDVVLALLDQANRATTGSHDHLATSAVALPDLVAALKPALRLVGELEYAPAEHVPSLPIITPRNGYHFVATVRRGSRVSIDSFSSGPAEESAGLGVLGVPLSTSNSSRLEASLASPLWTSVMPDGQWPPIFDDPKTMGPAATSLLDFLSSQVTDAITTRHVKRMSISGFDLPMTSAEPPLQILRDMIDASASSDLRSQATFRTSLLRAIMDRLTRASTATIVANRVANFVEFATEQAFQGWYADIVHLIKFVLSYIEKLLDESALSVPLDAAKPFVQLYKSANRLVLLALADDLEVPETVLNVLVHHQLTLFAGQNAEPEFFRLLVYRLSVLTIASREPAPLVDFFKLLVLQRSGDVEDALGQQRKHDFEPPFSSKAIDTDVEGFVTLLMSSEPQIKELSDFWDGFIAGEVSRLRPILEKDIVRLEELATSLKQKRDAQRKRMRTQRTAIYDWSEGIHEVEATRVAHTRQDFTDHAAYIHAEWIDRSQALYRERGIWGMPLPTDRWQLDFTQGPYRIRKKLQAELPKKIALPPADTLTSNRYRRMGNGSTSRHDSISQSPEITLLKVQAATPVPVSSPGQSNLPAEESMWVEGASMETTMMDSDSPEPVTDEDKNRKVRRSLESGDVIESVFNINRIVGLDAVAGLLLLAKKNVYIIDGFFQTSSGDLVDAWEAPEEERDRHLQTLAELAVQSTASAHEVDIAHRSRRWAWTDLLEVHERKYLFRNVALELFFADGRSFLLTFSKEKRQAAQSGIAARNPGSVATGSLHIVGATLGAKFSDAVLGQKTKLEHITKRWERREMSNFEYLMHLNTISGRTYADLTNYPVFPWVLADYRSDSLDLTDPATFRDLSKPMGAQNPQREAEFAERYQQLQELEDGTKPFHYGTHYSSAMITVGYLIRLRPFTESYLDLQGGFDHADRMFHNLAKAWDSCSRLSHSDVRELIPEFFFLPDFLRNANGLKLGLRQESDAPIDDVALPPWAKNDPRLFIELHRKALESDYVSAHLHLWIDLIWGYKSGTGDDAIKAVNVFHHLSYEGAIGELTPSFRPCDRRTEQVMYPLLDLDSIANVDERRAATSTIHSFGMTPKQLFSKPHPTRIPPLVAKATRPIFSHDNSIEQQYTTLIQSIVPVCDIGQHISAIHPSTTPEKTTATGSHTLAFPGDASHSVSWGYADQAVRVHAKGNNNPTSLFEGMHSEFVSAACFADVRTFVTASTDTNVSLWRWRWKHHQRGEVQFQQVECLRGHSDQVVCLAASRPYSIVVSGSDDKTAIIWDLNRQRVSERGFVSLRLVQHPSNSVCPPLVRACSGRARGARTVGYHRQSMKSSIISDTTGDIATCSGSALRLWTVNGVLMATQSTSNFVDPITAVAFSQHETAPLVATGHRGGRIMLWERVKSDTEPTGWALKLVHTLRHKDRLDARPVPDITCLTFTRRQLYSGDSSGRCYLWSPPGVELFLPDSIGGGSCMGCKQAFGLLETRRRCSSCAGIFCTMCTTTSVEVGGRFCASCFRVLSPLAVVEPAAPLTLTVAEG